MRRLEKKSVDTLLLTLNFNIVPLVSWPGYLCILRLYLTSGLGPLPRHIQIRTPESPANGGCLNMSNCAMVSRPKSKSRRNLRHGLALASVKTPCIVSTRELTPSRAYADDVSSHRLSPDPTGTIHQTTLVAAKPVAGIPYIEFLD